MIHYIDVIMTTMASQITSLTVVYSIVYSGADQRKYKKLRVTGLCAGTGEFRAQMASYAENVSIWWRHHERKTDEVMISLITTLCGCSRSRNSASCNTCIMMPGDAYMCQKAGSAMVQGVTCRLSSAKNIWTSDGLVLIGSFGTYFSEVIIKVQ